MVKKELDFSEQTPVIIRELMKSGMSREEAVRYWMHSKTKKRLEELGIDYVSGMRLVFELQCEMNNDRRWFNEPFDM